MGKKIAPRDICPASVDAAYFTLLITAAIVTAPFARKQGHTCGASPICPPCYSRHTRYPCGHPRYRSRPPLRPPPSFPPYPLLLRPPPLSLAAPPAATPVIPAIPATLAATPAIARGHPRHSRHTRYPCAPPPPPLSLAATPVIPAKAGIQRLPQIRLLVLKSVDSRFRGNDER